MRDEYYQNYQVSLLSYEVLEVYLLYQKGYLHFGDSGYGVLPLQQYGQV